MLALERCVVLYLLVGNVEFGSELLAESVELLLHAAPLFLQRETPNLILLLHFLKPKESVTIKKKKKSKRETHRMC